MGLFPIADRKATHIEHFMFWCNECDRHYVTKIKTQFRWNTVELIVECPRCIVEQGLKCELNYYPYLPTNSLQYNLPQRDAARWDKIFCDSIFNVKGWYDPVN